jgi:hypothetical protein
MGVLHHTSFCYFYHAGKPELTNGTSARLATMLISRASLPNRRHRSTPLYAAGGSTDEPAEAADSPSPRAECG